MAATPLERLIDSLVELSGPPGGDRPEVAEALLDAADWLDTYRILHGDLTARPGDAPAGILGGSRSLPARPAEPVPNRKQRRAAIAVRRGKAARGSCSR
jgi:hypothetical protein